jgi:muramoyltetrapeptide carboxypeptidase
MGFRLKCADNLSASKGGYMAGDEKRRAEWIHRMFEDPEVDAIFCIRGGGGASRIMEYIDVDVIKKNKKIFVGYSDITNLHLLFNQKCDLVTFHGPMVSPNIVDHFDKDSRVMMYEALVTDNEYIYKAPKGMPLMVGRRGQGKGNLVGGNLEVLCASLGTPYEVETDGKILFLEEDAEFLGKVDRHIFQLRNAGKLDHVVGIMLGQFEGCKQIDESYGILEIVLDAVKNPSVPILYNIQSGHRFPMITLPMGASCEMDTDVPMIRFHIEEAEAAVSVTK